ncbi:hypothetical protein [Paeniglutamicibacter kerguelensis]|uniref:Uncharacterized protein n=1 Tax=Paeniglutamicibacter kerguelensis TaxID=254788 RepID=A0ABS4XGJ0_9MICC|nr:hypothetical protein [Paeniglutamicibacter kerguelensis]MBP2387368.1 hypothetical protein [Paeniglutamicibacter kerguelensis]
MGEVIRYFSALSGSTKAGVRVWASLSVSIGAIAVAGSVLNANEAAIAPENSARKYRGAVFTSGLPLKSFGPTCGPKMLPVSLTRLIASFFTLCKK